MYIHHFSYQNYMPFSTKQLKKTKKLIQNHCYDLHCTLS